MVVENKVLLKINDLDVDIEITQTNLETYEVKISIGYNFWIAYQKNVFRIVLDKIALKAMISSLVNGQKSSHGNSDIWQANKIFIKKSNALVDYRNVWLYRRIFIFGLCFVPATISAKIIKALETFYI